MSAVATSIRALLLTVTLMILGRGTVAIPTNMLSSIGEDDRRSTGSSGRRHQPADKFEEVLKGPMLGEGDPIEVMMADSGMSRRRSLSGDPTTEHQKHITNVLHSTVFYHEKQNDGKLVLTAYNTTPNNSNSIFRFGSACMEPTIKRLLPSRACPPPLLDKPNFAARSADEGKLFKVEHEDASYFMCAKGDKVKLVDSLSIKTSSDAKDCVWKTFDIDRPQTKLIYTKYKNGCIAEKSRSTKCAKKRAFLTIHRKRSQTEGTRSHFKVLLRFDKPPSTMRKPRKFWRKKYRNETKFYLHNRNTKDFRYPNPVHQFTTERPHTPSSLVDDSVARPRRKKCRNNNLLTSCFRRRRHRGGRRKKKKKNNPLARREHSSRVSLIPDKPYSHKSLLDSK